MNNVSKLDLIKNCTGCTACYSICPINAISIKKNIHGFYNPVISNTCIECGKCLNVCQITRENSSDFSTNAIACKSKDDSIRMKSSSGGIFPILCESLSKRYGNKIMFVGAEWSDEMHVVHRLEPADRAQLFSGSKYVQSFLNSSFREIEKYIANGFYILFSGTGCQCQGLKLYLKERNAPIDKLFIVDIICHGVPSPQMWDDYIKAIEDQVHDKVVLYSFRDKSVSWHGIHPVIKTMSDKKIDNDEFVLSFGKLFGRLSLNECCHSCKFANLQRGGDITIGDFWGCEQSCPDFYDEKGVSLCLVNNDKGRFLVDLMQESIHVIPIKGDGYLQPNLKSPTTRHPKSNRFWHDYTTKGYYYVAKKYTTHSVLFKHVYSLLKPIRNKLRKL